MKIIIDRISRKASASIITIVLIVTSLSSVILFATPVRAGQIEGTFESDYATPKTTFMQGENVYGKGTCYTPGHFKLRILDPNDTIVYSSDPVYGTQVTGSLVLNTDAPTGKWAIQIGEFYDGSWNWSTEPGRIVSFEVISLPKYILTININSPGTVTKNPDQTTYNNGTLVQLTAHTIAGWTFSHWSGDLSSSNNPETVNMTADKNITAHFQKESTNGGGSNGGDTITTGKSTVENLPPIADLTAGEPYQGFVNSEMLFNASLSYDPDGYLTSWSWDFGDESNDEGETTTHVYLTAGVYTVMLTVTDNKGATNTSETSVLISQQNRPPSSPEINGSTQGNNGIDYTFTVVSTDDDNDSIKYVLDWGDGTINESEFLPNGTIFMISHVWETAGSYTIKATADDNNTISSSELTIVIEEPEPEEGNFILLFIALLVLLVLILLLSKRKKDKT
jgi:PKD repeat protein